MTKRQEEKLVKQIPTLKAVCPTCREEGNGNRHVFIKEGETLFGDFKVFKCRHGHVTTVSAFANGMLHTKFGPDDENFVNIEGRIEELEELIDKKEISCHHVRDNGRPCDCKLKAVDSATISYPSAAGIKTKTRLGDLWDKAGAEPVRSGTYDGKGNYSESRSQRANNERLKRMRERNLPEERHPGKRIDKATKKDYGRRSKSEVNPERLNGPK
ncbi:MAG: hypothetical protein K5880_14125 [Hydrogenophaga sp.]|uniref:hypothetical protein n=1 Tax=Hydrogenophaga sp. TaxID=1904254 RepID=UPI0026058A12|nr:hypothetical protein [Hydrogenophaga sp.]MCV0439760.1 hypothetical protein [Hydrogenophaga sp.]